MKLQPVRKYRRCLTDAQVIDVARLHFVEGKTLAKIAEAIRVSPSYLCRLVNDARGRVFDVKVVAR